MRTHMCGELRPTHVGQTVSVCGWVASRREHGQNLAFVDVRDHTGIVQCVVDGASDLRSEFVVRVTGTVRTRPEGTANPNLPTGDVEVGDCTVEILSQAEPPPFPIADRVDADENLRLRHRYVDLRRPSMQANLRLRATVSSAIRRSMEAQGFVEVETPTLIASTPEGARDFVVPSRLQPGSFYALPQSPQLFKQLLMVGGVDRYYQLARCLRDEPTASSSPPSATPRCPSPTRPMSLPSFPRRSWPPSGPPAARSTTTSRTCHGGRPRTGSDPTSPTCASAWSWSSSPRRWPAPASAPSPPRA